MSRLSKANAGSSKAKSTEFGKSHNEKAWREKRVTRKALRDRKRTVRPHKSSLKSKLHRRRDWKTHVVVEKNQWDDEGDDFVDYMPDDANLLDEEYEYPDEWGDIPAITARKMKHERQSAQNFVNLIGRVLGRKFHGQEFVRLPVGIKQSSDKTVAQFRIVVPDTTPRTSPEVWISLMPPRRFWSWESYAKRLESSRSIRLFRSGSSSLGKKTLAEFLDGVLNEILQDLFEISLPTTLVTIVSSFCNGSVLKFGSVAECCLTIGAGHCDWFPGQQEPPCMCCSCCGYRCYCAPPRCKCDGIHDIRSKVSACEDCDDEYWQFLSMSVVWRGMAAHAFGHEYECTSFDSYHRQRSRLVRTIMSMAKDVAMSWDEPASGMVVLPYKEDSEPLLGVPFEWFFE